jgi:hydroxyacylglutathione hydrolase
MRPILEVFTVGPFAENTYLFGDADAGVAIVVDPGGRAADIVRVADLRGVRITTIVNTHSHVDHVLGVAELQALTGAPFWLHPAAVPMLEALPLQVARFDLPEADVPQVDAYLEAGQVVQVGDIALTVRDTPGHAPGHVTLISGPLTLDDGLAPRAFVGDVIFHGSIGRVDLPGGDYETLMGAIEAEILTLADDTVLYPGHGPATTVGRERAFNPFLLERRRQVRS